MVRSAPILIAGPTASGKSALALALAERIGGVVINADSMQVYRELRVLTARPSFEDEARVPHALYGHVAAHDAYSAGRFVRDVREVLKDAERQGRTPVIVGGTGLYFKALLEGLAPVPEIDTAVRAYWREQGTRVPASELHAILSSRDPVTAAKLSPSDTQRVVRALEVLESTGRPLAEWQIQKGVAVLDEAAVIKFAVRPERAALYAEADARFASMVRAGAIDEVRALANLGLDAAAPALRALGVKPLLTFVEGRMSESQAVAQGQLETRQYIKRQITWLDRNMITWKQIKTQLNNNNANDIVSFIQS